VDSSDPRDMLGKTNKHLPRHGSDPRDMPKKMDGLLVVAGIRV
jgi:hypothetical protein